MPALCWAKIWAEIFLKVFTGDQYDPDFRIFQDEVLNVVKDQQ